jgi:superkiller protein 3
MKRGSSQLPLLALTLFAMGCPKRPLAVAEPKTAPVRMSAAHFATPTPVAAPTPGLVSTKSDAEWGEEFFRKGDFKRSIAYLSEAIKRDQGSAKLWRNLGSSYAMADDFDNAILCFERALKRNPSDIKSFYNLSLVHGWKGTLEDAEGAAKKGLKIDPKHSGLHSSLGNIYVDENKEDEALQEYHTALQLNPKDPVTRFNLGGLYFKRRELKEAEKSYVKVLELAPKDVEAAQNLAAVYILQDRMSDAEKLNKWVVKQKPKDEDTLENAYFNLGLIYDRQNKLEQALNMYKLALQVAPWDAAAYVNAAVILERLKRTSEALAFWEKYQRLFPASRRASEIGKRIEILKKMLKLEEPGQKSKASKKSATKA